MKDKKISIILVSIVSIIIIAINIVVIIIMKNDNNKNGDINSNEKQNANYQGNENNELSNERRKYPKDEDNKFYCIKYNNQEYYILNGEYQQDYDIQYKLLTGYIDEYNMDETDTVADFEVNTVMTYEEYINYCEKWDLNIKYNDDTKKYIVFSYKYNGAPNVEAKLGGVEYNNKKAKLYIWDDFDGVTGDISSYVVVIPTEKNINKVTYQELYTREEFNKIAGKNPLDGYSFTEEDNKKLAENCYINSNNEELNNIINNMLDAIVLQHTIEIESDCDIWMNCSSVRYIDLISSVEKTVFDEEILEYTTYTDSDITSYIDYGDGNFSSDKLGYTRDDLLKMIISSYKYILLEKPDKFDVSISEDDEYYIIKATRDDVNGGTSVQDYTVEEIYYINKDTYLLEKTYVDFSLAGYDNQISNSTFSYTDEVITIPSNVFENSRETITAYKPVIYLYPTEETEVTVKVGRPENLTHTYPKYIDKWNVIAKPNGDLVDAETGRNLYCLYWEGLNTVEPNMKEGFVVKGEDTIIFLEEKLEILGLTEREANEFIIYWLPKLESNKYNYIRFQTMEEINENMPLEITPTPDTVIRVLMEYKGLDNPINVTEQKLATPERNGFTVVEWGGTEIN